MAFSGALNSTLARLQYAIRQYRETFNRLLSQYVTRRTMASA